MSPIEREVSFGSQVVDSTSSPTDNDYSVEDEKNDCVFNVSGNESKEGTVGFALDAMEVRIRKSGVKFEFSSPNTGAPIISPLTGSHKASTGRSGKILRSQFLITLAIIQAIGDGHGMDSERIDYSMDDTALMDGNVIAFRGREGGYLQMIDNKVVRNPRNILDIHATHERFVVVRVGVDGVAFYSPFWHRFLYMEGDGRLYGSQSKVVDNDDRPRSYEIFSLEHLVTRKQLHSPSHKREASLFMDSFNVMQIRGFNF
jgi:hypothetical protein